MLGRPFKNPSMGAVGLGYGDDLKADFYFPVDADGSPQGSHWPVVVWMHPYSYTTGYSRDTQPFFVSLTQRGFAVLAFDQIAFGTRVRDARYFYQRYPKWSLLGKMVTDTRAAVDAVAALEAVDSSRIYLVGYALGAKVGLITAALDDRVNGRRGGLRCRSLAPVARRRKEPKACSIIPTCTGCCLDSDFLLGRKTAYPLTLMKSWPPLHPDAP